MGETSVGSVRGAATRGVDFSESRETDGPISFERTVGSTTVNWPDFCVCVSLTVVQKMYYQNIFNVLCMMFNKDVLGYRPRPFSLH